MAVTNLPLYKMEDIEDLVKEKAMIINTPILPSYVKKRPYNSAAPIQYIRIEECKENNNINSFGLEYDAPVEDVPMGEETGPNMNSIPSNSAEPPIVKYYEVQPEECHGYPIIHSSVYRSEPSQIIPMDVSEPTISTYMPDLPSVPTDEIVCPTAYQQRTHQPSRSSQSTMPPFRPSQPQTSIFAPFGTATPDPRPQPGFSTCPIPPTGPGASGLGASGLGASGSGASGSGASGSDTLREIITEMFQKMNKQINIERAGIDVEVARINSILPDNDYFLIPYENWGVLFSRYFHPVYGYSPRLFHEAYAAPTQPTRSESFRNAVRAWNYMLYVFCEFVSEMKGDPTWLITNQQYKRRDYKAMLITNLTESLTALKEEFLKKNQTFETLGVNCRANIFYYDYNIIDPQGNIQLEYTNVGGDKKVVPKEYGYIIYPSGDQCLLVQINVQLIGPALDTAQQDDLNPTTHDDFKQFFNPAITYQTIHLQNNVDYDSNLWNWDEVPTGSRPITDAIRQNYITPGGTVVKFADMNPHWIDCKDEY